MPMTTRLARLAMTKMTTTRMGRLGRTRQGWPTVADASSQQSVGTDLSFPRVHPFVTCFDPNAGNEENHDDDYAQLVDIKCNFFLQLMKSKLPPENQL